MNKQILKMNIGIHKILTKEIADGKHLDKIGQVGNDAVAKHAILGEEIALVLSGFKCETQGCNNEEITIHHLINGMNKLVVPLNKYISQRHYFFNLVILCREHHNIIDKENPKHPKAVITKENIERIKNKYGVKDGT